MTFCPAFFCPNVTSLPVHNKSGGFPSFLSMLFENLWNRKKNCFDYEINLKTTFLEHFQHYRSGVFTKWEEIPVFLLSFLMPIQLQQDILLTNQSAKKFKLTVNGYIIILE